MIEFGVSWHDFHCNIEVSVSVLYFFKGQESVSSVKKCTGIIWIQCEGLIVFYKRLIKLFIVIKSERFVIEVSGLISIELNCLFKSFQGKIVLLVFKVTQSQIVLGRSIIFDDFTSF
jgi:hypothetical protein